MAPLITLLVTRWRNLLQWLLFVAIHQYIKQMPLLLLLSSVQ